MLPLQLGRDLRDRIMSDHGRKLDADGFDIVYRYRFDMFGAMMAGETRHPQIVIRELAPRASDFEPVTISDCWLFSAPPIDDLPPFIERESGHDISAHRLKLIAQAKAARG